MSPWKVMILLLLVSPLAAAGEFLRIGPDQQSLQTAVTTYIHPSGCSVTLISAVHIGEKSYYNSIQEQLQARDAVVYEGIVRPVATIDFSDRWYTPLGLVAQQSTLHIDQSRSIRGDLSSEQFDLIAQPADKANPPTTRKQFAQELIDSMTDPALREKINTVCAIAPRNQAAIQSLKLRLARGDQQIAILYGAAHGDDLEKRLIDELGFKRQSQSWLTVFRF